MYRIVDERADMLVLDKESGVSVLADRTGAPCLWPLLQQRYGKPLQVHRIDKGTSGLLLIALSRKRQQQLTRAFTEQKIDKQYVAVVSGHLPAGRSLTISLPLRRGRKSRYRVAGLREEIRSSAAGWNIDSDDGLVSVTRVRRVCTNARRSLIAVQPKSGRTHQIRVHMAWVGHAIVGDHLYGAPTSAEQAWHRLALHCHRLRVPERFGTFVAPVPEDFDAAIAAA